MIIRLVVSTFNSGSKKDEMGNLGYFITGNCVISMGHAVLYQHSKKSQGNQRILPFLMATFIRSFHWHVQNATIPCHSQKLFHSCYALFPATLLHQLFFQPLSTHLTICFLVYHSILLFPNSYIIPFWEFYFLPFSVHAQTNAIYLSLLSLL